MRTMTTEERREFYTLVHNWALLQMLLKGTTYLDEIRKLAAQEAVVTDTIRVRP